MDVGPRKLCVGSAAKIRRWKSEKYENKNNWFRPAAFDRDRRKGLNKGHQLESPLLDSFDK